MKRRICLLVIGLLFLCGSLEAAREETGARGGDSDFGLFKARPIALLDVRALDDDVSLEANYILACQHLDVGQEAHGAINNIYGYPTWVVPRENAMAILGLIEATGILQDNLYVQRAQLAADYLISVQDGSDGAWYDQYDYETPIVLSKSPTQTAEVMIALAKLGYESDRYQAMKKGAQYLLACQDPINKTGNDDGLICGGKNDQGQYNTSRWASDNAYAFWALRAACDWAILYNDIDSAREFHSAAEDILEGINTYLYVDVSGDPDEGVWRIVVDASDQPINPDFHEWINYAPQMLEASSNTQAPSSCAGSKRKRSR